MENSPVTFVFDTEALAEANAAGFDFKITSPLGWPLVVGDTISFPQAPRLAFRVTSRHLQSMAGSTWSWLISLSKAEHPVLAAAQDD